MNTLSKRIIADRAAALARWDLANVEPFRETHPVSLAVCRTIAEASNFSPMRGGENAFASDVVESFRLCGIHARAWQVWSPVAQVWATVVAPANCPLALWHWPDNWRFVLPVSWRVVPKTWIADLKTSPTFSAHATDKLLPGRRVV